MKCQGGSACRSVVIKRAKLFMEIQQKQGGEELIGQMFRKQNLHIQTSIYVK